MAGKLEDYCNNKRRKIEEDEKNLTVNLIKRQAIGADNNYRHIVIYYKDHRQQNRYFNYYSN